VNSRLLAYEDRARTRRVEITHDVLAPVIRTSRDTRLTREALADAERKKAEAREKERVARHRLLVVGSLLVLSVIAGASFGLWKASLAKAETAKANEQTAWAEELQEQMTEQATQGELTAANDLKLEEEWPRVSSISTAHSATPVRFTIHNKMPRPPLNGRTGGQNNMPRPLPLFGRSCAMVRLPAPRSSALSSKAKPRFNTWSGTRRNLC
jgi:hypothetical protein